MPSSRTHYLSPGLYEDFLVFEILVLLPFRILQCDRAVTSARTGSVRPRSLDFVSWEPFYNMRLLSRQNITRTPVNIRPSYTHLAIVPFLRYALPHRPSIPIGIIAGHRSKEITRRIMTVSAFRCRKPRQATDDGVKEARNDAVDSSGSSSDVIWADIMTC